MSKSMWFGANDGPGEVGQPVMRAPVMAVGFPVAVSWTDPFTYQNLDYFLTMPGMPLPLKLFTNGVVVRTNKLDAAQAYLKSALPPRLGTQARMLALISGVSGMMMGTVTAVTEATFNHVMQMLGVKIMVLPGMPIQSFSPTRT